LAKCIFRKDWLCPFDAEEIPFEVCRLCIEARKTKTAVVRSQGMAEEPLTQPAEFRLPANPTEAEPIISSSNSVKNLSSRLYELDRQLFEDKIGIDEYLEERRKIIDSLKRNMENQFVGLEEILEVGGESKLGLILVKRGRFGVSATAYPRGLPLYKGLNRKLVESVFDLCASAKEQAENMVVKFKDVKLVKLALKHEKLMLLILKADQNPEEYEKEIGNALHELEKVGDWEKILPQLYEKNFKSKRLMRPLTLSAEAGGSSSSPQP